VVEDDPVSLKLAHLVLSSEGHQVFDATTAEQVVQVMETNQPEVVLLDLKLPNADGLSLARQLKHNPNTAHIPIVAVTSYPDRFSKTEAFNAGCDAYIIKPIDTRNLSQQLADAIARSNGGSPCDENSDRR
jgi:CheY-like chemotaxis protein